MIARTLKPSFILKSVGTSIQNKNFGCFVSTAKTGLFAKTSSIVFFREFGVRLDPKPLGYFIYSRNLSWEGRKLHHQAMVGALDILGEQGLGIFEAVESIYDLAISKGAIERSPFWEVGVSLKKSTSKANEFV